MIYHVCFSCSSYGFRIHLGRWVVKPSSPTAKVTWLSFRKLSLNSWLICLLSTLISGSYVVRYADLYVSTKLVCSLHCQQVKCCLSVCLVYCNYMNSWLSTYEDFIHNLTTSGNQSKHLVVMHYWDFLSHFLRFFYVLSSLIPLEGRCRR